MSPVATLIGSAGAGAVKFAVSGLESDDSGSLTVSNGTTSTVLAVSGNGTYTAALSGGGWADGTVSSNLTVSGAPAVAFTVGLPDGEETGSPVLTDGVSNSMTVTVTGAGTYTENLSGWADGTVSAALSVSDTTGNSFTATGNSVTLVSGNVPTLPLASLSAKASKSDIYGDISDPNAGTITLSAYDGGGSPSNYIGPLGTATFVFAANTTLSFTFSTTNRFKQGDTITLTAWEATGGTASAAFLDTGPAGAAGSQTNLALTDPSGVTGESVAVTIAGVPAGWSLNAGTNLGNGTWVEQGTDLASLAITTPAGFAGAVVLAVSESWTNPNGSTGSMSVADNVEAYAPGAPIFALSGNDTLTGSGTNDLFVSGPALV